MSVQEKHCEVCGATHLVESTREIRAEAGSVACPNCGASIHSWQMGVKWRLSETADSPLPNNYLPYHQRHRHSTSHDKRWIGEKADYNKAQ
ncbi:MAG: hypothetical protein IT366_19215 [Candidatus Hydrogenedentes bacterium]|nr:hypothetical protein [Candidatus Hydrogenedentota bacterium]